MWTRSWGDRTVGKVLVLHAEGPEFRAPDTTVFLQNPDVAGQICNLSTGGNLWLTHSPTQASMHTHTHTHTCEYTHKLEGSPSSLKLGCLGAP